MAETKETLLQTQAWVTRQFPGKDIEQEDENEVVEIHKFATAPANVTVEMGMTINLGNYEFARISVGISVPCYKEDVDDAWDYAKDWVNKKTLEEAEEARVFASKRDEF